MDVRPGANIRLLASDDDLQSTWQEANLSIRFGNGIWRGFETAHLFREEVFAVCSPEYARKRSLSGLGDLCKCTLLNFDRKSLDGIDWESWLGFFGLRLGADGKELRFNNYPIVLQAALDGQGVALGWDSLVSSLIDEGRLVRPIADVIRTDKAYWLTWRRDRDLSDDAREIRDWLVSAGT